MMIAQMQFADTLQFTGADIVQMLESDEYADKLLGVIAPIQQSDPEIYQTLVAFLTEQTTDLLYAFGGVDDRAKVDYLLAVAYATLRSKWIIHNSHLQFRSMAGNDENTLFMYRATLLSTIISFIEPLISEKAVANVRDTLAEPIPFEF